jgi:UDP-N-acetylglucosamine diphosphorylase/glucosamine-1-phosphate N-acetyltransferase
MNNELKAIILAAGKGTRLQTEGCDLPKVMRQALNRPLLQYVLDALAFIPRENMIIVVGYKKEKVMAYFKQYTFAEQNEQLGTGHAVMCAADSLAGFHGSVLICCGDMPLIQKDTYVSLVHKHFEEDNDCTILTSVTKDNKNYGRIVRDEDGKFLRMVEEKDCTEAEKRIQEINSGVYVFKTDSLLPTLSALGNNNAQGEYYLTDVPEILRRQGAKIGICRRELGNEIIGVNTVEQLQAVEKILRAKE